MAIGAEIAPADPAPIRTVWIGAEMVRGVDLTAASSRHDDARGWGSLVSAHASQCGLVVRPTKGFGSRLRWRRGGRGSSVVKHAATESLGHTQWSMRHSHTKATSTNW